MKTRITLILIITIASLSYPWGKGEKKGDGLQLEIDNLNEMLRGVRDSLEAEIAARYSFKQHTVEQRETDKEEYERFREKQENALTNLSKIKEEALVKEQNLGEAKKTAKENQEEWVLVKNSLDEMMQKDAETVIEAFPTDLERQQADLEHVRRLYKEKMDPISGWDEYLNYRIGAIETGKSVGITEAKLLPDDGAPRQFSIARFGNVFAYCQDSSNTFYMIRQSGRLGSEKYAVQSIQSSDLNGFLLETLPTWLQNNQITGNVMTEVMQNEQAKLLVDGVEKKAFEEFIYEIKAGGWVMIPLLMLPFYALALILHKIIQLNVRRRKYDKQLKTAFELIDKKSSAQALSYVKSNKGLMARIIEVCLDSPKHRDYADNEVRKLIMQEVPELNSNLNTIAVIAGAAPLLGLLGTISGMIALFAAVTHYGTGDPKFLAGGISEALITSKTGLIIAVPTLFIHDQLRNLKDKMLSNIENMAIKVLDKTVPEI